MTTSFFKNAVDWPVAESPTGGEALSGGVRGERGTIGERLKAGGREAVRGLAVAVVGDMRDLHHHGCEAVMRGILGALEAAGLEVAGVWAGLGSIGRDEALEEIPVAVVNGEGALHGGREVVDRLLDWAERRRAKGKVTMLLNTSWFENGDERTRRLAAFDGVVAREPWSAGEIRRGGVAVDEAPDAAVGVAMDFGRWQGTGGGVVVSDSTTPAKTRALERLASGRGWRYVPILAYPTEERPGAKSRKIRRRVAMIERWGGCLAPLFSPRYRAHRAGLKTLEEYLEVLSGAEGVVTGRFHTVCLALGLGVPLVAVGSNTPKIEAMLEAAGLDPMKRMVGLDRLGGVRGVEPYDGKELEGLERFRREAARRRCEWVWALKAMAGGGRVVRWREGS